jgi:hypothetical protein
MHRSKSGGMETTYQISSAKIAHQNIDGEVIVIHYDTGHYYSLSGAAAALWQALTKPQTFDHLRARFEAFPPRAEDAVKEFLRALVNEGLLETTAADAVSDRSGPTIPFGELIIEKYADMQTILLADPIHDVEQEEGWPRLRAED